METCHEVYLDGEPVGKLQLIRQGLYVRIVCRCVVPDDGIYRLYAVTDGARKKLGVVMPEGSGYILDRKIPAKQLDGCRNYLLSQRQEEDSGKFVPICPEEPFSYISQLENAFLEIRGGQIGARIGAKPGAE